MLRALHKIQDGKPTFRIKREVQVNIKKAAFAKAAFFGSVPPALLPVFGFLAALVHPLVVVGDNLLPAFQDEKMDANKP